MESLFHIDKNESKSELTKLIDPHVKVICLDLDETLIRATRIACNNSGTPKLKYWGQRVAQCREKEISKLIKNKPLDCKLSNEEYIKQTYGPQVINNPHIASPYMWSFPNDISDCWTLIRCNNNAVTSFYRIQYRPYCQKLIETINKYKKKYQVKVVISTLATKNYGDLIIEGLQLFKGYFETINGVSTPLVDKFIALEDWREITWKRYFPQHNGKKSLPFVEAIFDVQPSQIIAVDDKPHVWTHPLQVISVAPYHGGLHFKQPKQKKTNDFNNSNNSNNNLGNNDLETNDDNMNSNSNSNSNDISDDINNININDDNSVQKKIVDDVLHKLSNHFEYYFTHLVKVSKPKISNTQQALSSKKIKQDLDHYQLQVNLPSQQQQQQFLRQDLSQKNQKQSKQSEDEDEDEKQNIQIKPKSPRHLSRQLPHQSSQQPPRESPKQQQQDDDKQQQQQQQQKIQVNWERKISKPKPVDNQEENKDYQKQYKSQKQQEKKQGKEKTVPNTLKVEPVFVNLIETH